MLVPIVSGKENNTEFLQKAVENGKEIILLLVIDQRELIGQFGFAASGIKQGTALMEQIKAHLEAKGLHPKDIEEWGDTETKIEHIALLQRVDKVLLLEQDNEYFRNLVKQLGKKLSGKIEIFKVPEPSPLKEENFGIGKT